MPQRKRDLKPCIIRLKETLEPIVNRLTCTQQIAGKVGKLEAYAILSRRRESVLHGMLLELAIRNYQIQFDMQGACRCQGSP